MPRNTQPLKTFGLKPKEKEKVGVQSTYEKSIYDRLVEDAKRHDRAIHKHQRFIVREYLDTLTASGVAGQ